MADDIEIQVDKLTGEIIIEEVCPEHKIEIQVVKDYEPGLPCAECWGPEGRWRGSPPKNVFITYQDIYMCSEASGRTFVAKRVEPLGFCIWEFHSGVWHGGWSPVGEISPNAWLGHDLQPGCFPSTGALCQTFFTSEFQGQHMGSASVTW